jgi:chromatin segregation and condensation protein Rec8/ScpA/Scc1 (kleisin family)
MIGLFLATLELIRQRRIAVEQTATLGDIRIVLRADAGDQRLFAGETPVADHPSAPPVAPDTRPESNN